MSKSRITFLGTGTSTGIPMVGCPCEVCQSKDKKDQRLRASLYVEMKNLSFIVDTGQISEPSYLEKKLTRVTSLLSLMIIATT